MINSKKKGARFEREIASRLKSYGFTDARRTAQYCGNTGDASDVVGLPGIHIECKNSQHFRIYEYMAQAIRDSSKTENKPAVFFRKNNAETLVCMRLDDWMELYKGWLNSYETKDPKKVYM